MTRRSVIVGAGHGGSQLSVSLRQEGYDGEIVLVSDEPDLPYHRPPLSKSYLKSPDAGGLVLRAENAYRDANVELVSGVRAIKIDAAAQTVELSDGQVLPYSELVLATGARARIPDLPGVDLEGVVTLRTIMDARSIRERIDSIDSVAIVGGGFIGMEMAHSFVGLGKKVTLIEAAPRVLARSVAPIVSAHVERRSREAGIDILTDVQLAGLEGENGRVSAVTTSDGRTIAADLVVLGIGAIPNVELARDAGLLLDNGIVVNESLQSSAAGIWAIGDCVSYDHKQAKRRVRLESVQNATDQARHLARVLVGRETAYDEVAWFWSDQGDMKLQTAGLCFDADRALVSGSPEDNAFSVYHFRGDELIAVDSVNKPADHMVARRLLAAGVSPTEADIAAGPQRMKELSGGRAR